MILEYKDIKPLIPQMIADAVAGIRKEVENEVFLSYPVGMQKHLCDDVVSEATYQRVYKLWNSSGFPQTKLEGIKGVYLSELKAFRSK